METLNIFGLYPPLLCLSLNNITSSLLNFPSLRILSMSLSVMLLCVSFFMLPAVFPCLQAFLQFFMCSRCCIGRLCLIHYLQFYSASFSLFIKPCVFVLDKCMSYMSLYWGFSASGVCSFLCGLQIIQFKCW